MMLNDITLNGFYNYDPSILTGLDLPEGIDEEQLRFTILDNAGMMYPYHQVLPQLGIAIHNWFTQNKDNFARIIAAVSAEYNPIENYDRKEDRTQGRTENRTEDKTGVTSDSSNSTTGTNSNTTSNSNSTSQRAADNSEAFRNVNKEIGSATSAGNSTATSSGNSTQNVTEGIKSGTTENLVESLRVHGNIGVMTNQMMVQAELDLRRYNIYEDICNRFVDKFLLGVYD